jgi:hypothetical protein
MKTALLLVILSLSISVARAQNDPDTLTNTDWTNPPQFARDVFTFIRLRPENHFKWNVDWPDSDLNFPFRLHQLTSLNIDTHSRTIDITSPELFDYPFVYIVEPGSLHLTEKEVEILRGYLLNGGCLMFDDFWGPSDWQNLRDNLKRIFPDREPVELELDHPIYHVIFNVKEKPQIPQAELAVANRYTGIFWEQGAKGSHFYGVFDDKGRMMVFVSRDNDFGDSWEKEGYDPWFFHEFSEKRGYPLSINVVMYLLTH